jgi:hypothetical protein
VSRLRDQNGKALRPGDVARYCGDLFEVVGEENGSAVVRPTDPEVGMHLRIRPSELLRVSCRPKLGARVAQLLRGWLRP